jgi:flagellar basal body-associated protein FliL
MSEENKINEDISNKQNNTETSTVVLNASAAPNENSHQSNEHKKNILSGLKEKISKLKGEIKGIKFNFNLIFKLPKLLLEMPLILIKGDLATKFLGLAFLFAIFLTFFSSYQIYKIFIKPAFKSVHKIDLQAEKIKDFEKLQKQFQVELENLVYLDLFQIALKNKAGNLREVEAEFFLECSSQDLSAWIKANLTAVREVVLNTILEQTFENLTTVDGKEKLKSKILVNLNTFLKKQKVEGHIVRVWISNLSTQ